MRFPSSTSGYCRVFIRVPSSSCVISPSIPYIIRSRLVSTTTFPVHSWGSGTDGKLGHGEQTFQAGPKPIPELADCQVKDVGCGASHSCALLLGKEGGKVFSWGSNFYGQVGLVQEHAGFFDGDDQVPVPTQVRGESFADEDIVQVATGDYHTLALSASGKVFSWGGGLLGNGTEYNDSNPQPVRFFTDIDRRVVAIAAHGATSAVLAVPVKDPNAPREVYVWGYIGGANGELNKATHPVLVANALDWTVDQIFCGPGSVGLIARDSEGGLKCVVYGLGVPMDRNLFAEREAIEVTDVWLNTPTLTIDLPADTQTIALGHDIGLVLTSKYPLSPSKNANPHSHFLYTDTGTLSLFSSSSPHLSPLPVHSIRSVSIGPNNILLLQSTGDILLWGPQPINPLIDLEAAKSRGFWSFFRSSPPPPKSDSITPKDPSEERVAPSLLLSVPPRLAGVVGGMGVVRAGWEHFACANV
ncbi:regulator of chromosome condensation 1/beta-lactamase-inhibitor protein II [Phlyctochytrium arcticum]|nr:regulator of chromosome condensation 1/beta-lactamase-inhibitor protein II [Phlyctochytrium arcticum]